MSITYYNEDRPRQAYELALLGCTDKEIAAVMGIDIMTLDSWKRNRPTFRDALHQGKVVADAKVAAALYKKAVGFEYEEEVTYAYKGIITSKIVTKHVPPDAWSCVKWLSLRQREHWSDSQKDLPPGTVNNTQININQFDLSKLSKDELLMLKNLAASQKPLEIEEGTE